MGLFSKKKLSEYVDMLKKEEVFNEPKPSEKDLAEPIKEVDAFEDAEADEQPKTQSKKQTKAPETTEPEQEEEKVVQVPVFLTQAELNKMLYENNLMLRQLITALEKEE